MRTRRHLLLAVPLACVPLASVSVALAVCDTTPPTLTAFTGEPPATA